MISFLLALDHHRHDCHHLITVRTQDNGADEYEQLTDRIKANNESTLSPNTVVIQRLIQDRPVQFRRFCPISLSPELPMMPILWTNRTIAVSGPNNIFGDATFSSRKVSVGARLYNWIGAALWPDLIFQINKQNLCTLSEQFRAILAIVASFMESQSKLKIEKITSCFAKAPDIDRDLDNGWDVRILRRILDMHPLKSHFQTQLCVNTKSRSWDIRGVLFLTFMEICISSSSDFVNQFRFTSWRMLQVLWFNGTSFEDLHRLILVYNGFIPVYIGLYWHTILEYECNKFTCC